MSRRAKICYLIYQRPPLDPILHSINSIRITTVYLKINSRLHLVLASGISLQFSRINSECTCNSYLFHGKIFQPTTNEHDLFSSFLNLKQIFSSLRIRTIITFTNLYLSQDVIKVLLIVTYLSQMVLI